MKKTKPYFMDTVGEVSLKVVENREGLGGEWTMEIGGGTYGDWESAVLDGRKTEKAKKLDALRALLADDPDASTKDLAKALDVDKRTVERYRKELNGDAD